MGVRLTLLVEAFLAIGLMCISVPSASAQDPEIDKLLRGPVGKDWVTNGGNLTNQRYSTLKQIDIGNVKQLKGAWMTRLKGSGMGGKYSAEATPLVKDGIMYVVTGNDDVFALNAKTGDMIWERWSHIDQTISTVCCGWLNRGLALGEGNVFLGQLDTNVVALDMKTGKEVWKTPIEDWHNGYVVTSAPLYYDGIVYSGIAGGEYGTRGRLTALDAKTGKILWRAYTLPAAGEIGSDTWPPNSQAMHGGATIWNTPAIDPELGQLYFATGNCGPDYDGTVREGDNLFCASIMAIDAKTGQYKWHFQEVHHDIWDYDAASPVVLFDTTVNGQPRKAAAEVGRTGWVYILDRTNGKPLIGIEEKPVPQEPRQKTAKTQPIPIGDPTVPQCAKPSDSYPVAGCLYDVFWDTPVVIQPGGQGGTNWSPMPYSPDTGLLYVPGTIRSSAFVRYGENTWKNGMPYSGGTQSPPINSELAGTFTAITANTNKIAWQQQMPYRMGGGGGSTVTAGGLLLRGEPDGNLVALDAKTGDVLFKFQTGFGADAPPTVYEVDGQEYITIVAGGNRIQGSATGDAVWTFALNGNVQPLWPPPTPATVAGPLGPISDGVNKVQIGANNTEFSYFPARTRVKPGTTVTFTNVGDLPHSATAAAVGGTQGKWDTDILGKGETKTITFDKPGTYYYICTPHPFMYGQVIVEP
jgi:alcohol dehydrogenase (cytochrome c)